MFIFGASKESGWRIPFDGDIDKNLRVTAGPADELEDFKLELRWEFLASPEGAAEDWQLMRQDMNNVLEKRWAKHWGGDNGTDIFFVEANGFKYGIDCRCMVQSNLQTHRKRRIRRGLPRPNMTQVLPKLAAKDAEIERLQADKHGLLDERTELAAKVAKLECLGSKSMKNGGMRGSVSQNGSAQPLCHSGLWPKCVQLTPTSIWCGSGVFYPSTCLL